MSTRIVSTIQKIDYNIHTVYPVLADCTRIGRIFDYTPGLRQTLEQQKPEFKQISEKIEDIRTTPDGIIITLQGLGDISLDILEREDPKLIKFGSNSDRSPFAFSLWIQLLENGGYDTRLRITCEAELNMMLKMMLKGKLDKGIEALAEGLAKVPYHAL